MTLILTSLSHERILQVADRWLTWSDGQIEDDDTNKAVFYGGRVAVAYTGVSQVGGRPTAEWIGWCIKDIGNTEAAMKTVAERAEQYFGSVNWPNKMLAVVATGWATHRGVQPPLPFICVASNFMNDSWRWEPSVNGPMTVRYKFLPKNSAHELFVAGQPISPEEVTTLNRYLRRAVEHNTSGKALVSLLVNAHQFVAQRNKRVGKGMIIQQVSRSAVMRGDSTILTPLTEECHSFLYVSKDGKTSPFQGAVLAGYGSLLTGFSGGEIPPDGKSVFILEIESRAKQYPIHLEANEVQFSCECPFCAREGKNQSEYTPNIVSGELPLHEKEAWIYCRGKVGHLLSLQRKES